MNLDSYKDKDLIEHLENKGYVVTIDQPEHRQIKLQPNRGKKVRFGVVSDTHLGNKYQQITYLHDFYRRAKEFKVNFMLHAGDLVDGQNMHKDQQFELFAHGVKAQAQYAIKNYPYIPKVNTYVIGGNHDGSGWKDSGADVLAAISAGRPDIVSLGAIQATFHFGPLRIMLMHPDGGVAYARSYKLQKIVEGFEADNKPHILLCGHWHIQCHVSVRNVEAFAIPCFQAQTPFMKRKGLNPVIGGYLFEVEYDESGLVSLWTNFVRYSAPIEKDYPYL